MTDRSTLLKQLREWDPTSRDLSDEIAMLIDQDDEARAAFDARFTPGEVSAEPVEAATMDRVLLAIGSLDPRGENPNPHHDLDFSYRPNCRRRVAVGLGALGLAAVALFVLPAIEMKGDVPAPQSVVSLSIDPDGKLTPLRVDGHYSGPSPETTVPPKSQGRSSVTRSMRPTVDRSSASARGGGERWLLGGDFADGEAVATGRVCPYPRHSARPGSVCLGRHGESRKARCRARDLLPQGLDDNG